MSGTPETLMETGQPGTKKNNGLSNPDSTVAITGRKHSPVAQSPVRLTVVPKYKFVKAKDGRGRTIDGLWLRNRRYYYQMSVPGKGCRRVSLVNEQNEPVKSPQQAKEAIEVLRRKRREGETPRSGRVPRFDEFVEEYLKWSEETQAKKAKTRRLEKCFLRRWAGFFGSIRLNRIMLRDVTQFALMRKQEGAGNRTVNLYVLVLGNLFRFARKQGVFSGKLPTEDWEPLQYKAARQKLFTREEIERFCATAVSANKDGTPRFKNGDMVADVVRLMSLCGARISSALALRWSDVDWNNRQLHLTRDTKYSKHIVIDLSPELEAHLRQMCSRRIPDAEAMFPATRGETSDSVKSLRKTFELVRSTAGLPAFKFHSLRHYFISQCVMAGIDLLTIASWSGHADTLLISRVYGHLNNEHKQEAAKKLVFDAPPEGREPNGSPLVDVNKLSVADLLQLAQQKMRNGNGQAAA